MTSRTALVTGASGYIGLHVVNVLLEAGWTVHATVRKLTNEKKVRPLKKLSEKHPGALRLYEADLLVPNSFSDAILGCSVVFHVASPFIVPEKVKDPQKDLIRPAIEGTRNVLESVNQTESVKRVVLTSSLAAIYGDNADVLKMENRKLHERYWNESSTPDHNAYQYSKTIAEREAWKVAESQTRWDLVAICPGFVLGPSLTPGSDSGSLDLLDQLLKGNYMVPGVPDLGFVMVDVRDVAVAHLKAAEVEQAKGRYVISHSKMTTFLDVSNTLKQVHTKPRLLPSWNMPNLLFRVAAPLVGVSQRWITANIGIEIAADNARSIEELGMEYRPVTEMLLDHYRSWAAEQGSA